MKEPTIRWVVGVLSSQENHPPICCNQKRWSGPTRWPTDLVTTWIFLSGVLVMDDVWGAYQNTMGPLGWKNSTRTGRCWKNLMNHCNNLFVGQFNEIHRGWCCSRVPELIVPNWSQNLLLVGGHRSFLVYRLGLLKILLWENVHSLHSFCSAHENATSWWFSKS